MQVFKVRIIVGNTLKINLHAFVFVSFNLGSILKFFIKNRELFEIPHFNFNIISCNRRTKNKN